MKAMKKKTIDQDKENGIILSIMNLNDPVLGHIMEECFEVIVAAQSKDYVSLAEELGDVYALMTIVSEKYNVIKFNYPNKSKMNNVSHMGDSKAIKTLINRISVLGKHINKMQRFGPEHVNPKTRQPARIHINTTMDVLAAILEEMLPVASASGEGYVDILMNRVESKLPFLRELHCIDH